MIVLTSNGLSGERLLCALEMHHLSGRCALVVTADNEYKEKNYHVERLTTELQRLGLVVECFDFDCQTPADLAKYDVIELIGGNPYYLLHSIRENGFADVLADFAKRKAIIGCSAGSLVLTSSLQLIHMYTPEMNIVHIEDLTGCRLTDVQILPHYSKFVSRYNGFEEKCRQYEQANRCTVVRLNDGEGVIVDGANVTVVRLV